MVDKPSWWNNGWIGFGLVAIGNIVMMTIVSDILGAIPGFYAASNFILFIGVFQLIYVIPLVVIAKVKRKTAFIKGAIVAASLTFLLNATCFGLFIFALSQLH